MAGRARGWSLAALLGFAVAATRAVAADGTTLPPPKRTTRSVGTPPASPPAPSSVALPTTVPAPIAPRALPAPIPQPTAAPATPRLVPVMPSIPGKARPGATGPDAASPHEAADDDPRVEVTVGLDVLAASYDRGFLIEASQAVVQPWVSLDARLLSWDGAVRDLRFVADLWASFQDGESGLRGAPEEPAVWYEGDVWAGLASHVGERLDVRLDYQWSWSPNGSYERFEEVALQLSHDDEPAEDAARGRWRGFAPRAVVVAEVRGQNDDGTTLGWFLEVGAEPRWSLVDEGPSLELSLPLRAGFSLDGYYEDADGDDETFGFLEGGARLSVDLERLAPCLAGVVAVATVGGIALGEHAAEAGDGRRTRLLASLSIQWEP